MDKFELKTKVNQELKGVSQNFVVNFSVNQHHYNLAYLVVLEHLMKELQLQGLYVSLNLPYEKVCEDLKSNKLDPNAIYCIDGVSKETGKFSDSQKCFCLEDPSSLPELLLLIETLCNEGKIKFIVLCSLSTLLLYNDEVKVEKFARSLINKARKSNVSVALMSPKEKNEEDVQAIVTQFCDKEIEL